MQQQRRQRYVAIIVARVARVDSTSAEPGEVDRPTASGIDSGNPDEVHVTSCSDTNPVSAAIAGRRQLRWRQSQLSWWHRPGNIDSANTSDLNGHNPSNLDSHNTGVAPDPQPIYPLFP